MGVQLRWGLFGFVCQCPSWICKPILYVAIKLCPSICQLNQLRVYIFMRGSTFRRYLGNKGARDDSYSLVKGAVEESNEPKNHRVGGHVAMNKE